MTLVPYKSCLLSLTEGAQPAVRVQTAVRSEHPQLWRRDLWRPRHRMGSACFYLVFECMILTLTFPLSLLFCLTCTVAT